MKDWEAAGERTNVMRKYLSLTRFSYLWFYKALEDWKIMSVPHEPLPKDPHPTSPASITAITFWEENGNAKQGAPRIL